MERASHSSGALWGWLPPLVLAGYFLALVLATTKSHHEPLDVAILAVLYLLLAITLHGASVFLSSLARPLGLIGSLVVGAAVVWHLREQTMVPSRAILVATASAAVALIHFVVVLRGRRVHSRARSAGVFVGAALLFSAVIAVSYQASSSFRWHLLRHNKLIGTPVYYLLADSVKSLRAELWARNTAASRDVGAPPGPTGLPPVSQPVPHIVFIMIDTLRADALAAYGGSPDLMPELNRFAEKSLVFTDVLSNAPWTRPSVASFFTGLLPEEHGAIDREFGLPDARVTIAELLNAAGYETAAFVTNYGNVGRHAGFAQGFDHFEHLDGGASPYMRAEQVNDAVATWLAGYSRRESDRKAPVFLYVHYLDPHSPYLSGGPTSMLRYRRAVRAAYESELRYLDEALGRLFGVLKERLPGSALIFVASDHGEEFGEHGEGGHGHSLYREVTHVPAILHSPGGDTGRIRAKLEARDFFDLLLQLPGADDFDFGAWAVSRSKPTRYASVYLTTPSSLHRPYQTDVCMRGLEENGQFLIWSAYGSSYELYDLERDPAQRRNMGRQRSDTVEAMASRLNDPVDRWVVLERARATHDTEELMRALGYVE